jgi:hypothetical protein
MKSKSFGLITAIAVILWACNANNVSRSGHLLSNIEHIQSNNPSHLLGLQKKSLAPQQVKKYQPKQKQVFTKTTIQSSNLQESQLPVLSSYQAEPPLTLKSLYKELDVAPQIFTIHPNQDNTLNCVEGTEIFIPKGSFELDEEDDNATVSIQVKEYYGKSALLMGNLGTVSNDQLIESGGTIYMEANLKGKQVQLKKGKNFEIKFPTKGKKKKEDMELFTGEKQKDGQINWLSNGNMNYQSTIKGTNQPQKYIPRVRANPKINFNQFNNDLQKKYLLPKDQKFRKIKQIATFKFVISPAGKLLSVSTDSLIDPRFENAILPLLKKLDHWKVINNNYNKSFNRKKNTDTITEYITVKFYNRRVKVKGNYIRNDRKNKTWWGHLKDMSDQNTIPNQGFTYSNDTLTNSAMKYAFSSNKMGWINCDRFLGSDRPLANVEIPGSDEFGNTDFKLILKKINSIMPAYANNQGYVFPNIPKGYEATLLAIKVENNQIYATSKEIIAGEAVGKIVFTPITKDELIKLLSEMNT